MANPSSTYGQVTFHCDQETLDYILKENESWYYGLELDQNPVPDQPLNFVSMGHWTFLFNIKVFFNNLTPPGPVTIDWDFHDFEQGMNVFYHADCTIKYDPMVKNQTQIIKMRENDIELTAKNLEIYSIVDVAGDLYTNYGLQNLKDYVVQSDNFNSNFSHWIKIKSIQDLRTFCINEDLINPKMGIYMADDVENLAYYLEDYMFWSGMIN